MKKMVLTLVLAACALTTEVASAKNVWRECGIGGMLFRKTGWAAITSNIIWDLGTTATTSSVLSDDLCEGPKASTAGFVNESYATLEEETAAGQGSHLTAMLNMLGCDGKSHPQIISGLRSELQEQMSDASYARRTKSENAEIFFNATISKAEANKCQAI